MVTQLDFAQVWQGLEACGLLVSCRPFALGGTVCLQYSRLVPYYKGVCRRSAQDPNQPAVDIRHPVSLLWLYKVTVSGFALNYATPGGLMGGEPYRIMELAPRIGTERASSSVILYAMTHIFSHFWFWLLSLVLLFVTHHVGVALWPVAALAGAFCILGIWFFMSGYRKGMANRLMKFLRHIPFVKRWAKPFVETHRTQLDTIDRQIAALHRQDPVFFVSSVLLELSCRVASALEIYFV